MTEIKFDHKTVFFEGHSMVLPYSVLDAFRVKDKIIVLLNPDEFTDSSDVARRNLWGFDANGTKLWEADFPQHYKSDYYYRAVSREPLIVSSFSSFDSQIDPMSGKVVKAEFFK